MAIAAEWYQKSAAQGYVRAEWKLGNLYSWGHGIIKSDAKAIEWWIKAASHGDAELKYGLGRKYQYGNGVPKDEGKAIEWLEKAAAQGGYMLAITSLADRYANGDGVPQDYAKEFQLRLKAARNNTYSRKHIGMMYAEGKGVPKDDVLAYAWYNLSREYGVRHRDTLGAKLTARQIADAQKLSVEISTQMGDTEATEVIELKKSFAAHGDPNAAWELATIYLKGDAIPKHEANAAEWFQKAVILYQKAAAQGDRYAQRKVGEMHAEGKGLTQDYVRAYAWYNLSGFADGRDKVESKMTPEKIAEAQKLSEKLLENMPKR